MRDSYFVLKLYSSCQIEFIYLDKDTLTLSVVIFLLQLFELKDLYKMNKLWNKLRWESINYIMSLFACNVRFGNLNILYLMKLHIQEFVKNCLLTRRKVLEWMIIQLHAVSLHEYAILPSHYSSKRLAN